MELNLEHLCLKVQHDDISIENNCTEEWEFVLRASNSNCFQAIWNLSNECSRIQNWQLLLSVFITEALTF